MPMVLSGIEQGQLKWDATTGAIRKTTDFSIDTNGNGAFHIQQAHDLLATVVPIS